VLGEHWHCITGHNDLGQVDEMVATNPNNLSGVDWKIYDATTGDGITREFVAEYKPTNWVPGVAGAAPTIFDAECRYFIDGQLVCKHVMNGTFQITAATTQLMNFGVVCENITDICVLNMLYLKCEQLRYVA
ncbi:MAG TPA: hypothetical protein VMX97_01295, partial [Hyphomicrobiaceae bacterium]|nr:hypothetical protein [Hyphomicrobiaceae bacterium]